MAKVNDGLDSLFNDLLICRGPQLILYPMGKLYVCVCVGGGGGGGGGGGEDRMGETSGYFICSLVHTTFLLMDLLGEVHYV